MQLFYLLLKLDLDEAAYGFFLKMSILSENLVESISNVNYYITDFLYEYSNNIICNQIMVEFFKLKEANPYIYKMKKIVNSLEGHEKERYIESMNSYMASNYII